MIIGASIFVAIFLLRDALKREIALGETQEPNRQLIEDISLNTNEEDQNLTQALLVNLFNNIKDKGLVKFNVLNTTLLEGNPLKPFPEINKKELTVTQDVFGKSQISYFVSIINISQKYIKEYELYKPLSQAIKDISEKRDSTTIKKQALGYQKIIEEYYKVTVPAQWLEVHKSYLSYFKTRQMVYEVIGDFDKDPLKAYFAATLLESLNEENKKITLLIDEKAKENNLDFNEVFKSL